ncbi:DUF2818 family protein [Glaciimonas sp. CA11.2]|uniref:DUF2818 family protein n=1 Tax=unclassified Glaciimonas TaxID=2644401 RepID=UPI002AB581CE|nr:MULTISPECIES: DUF2818 family protein [unclassified Glaciimonas]MDY7544769.1 DUF2818 family protein [Glaciimonas sp. CA11.2]MEB0011933.1 DUF2818 family protein [Glaciimonas sp. Cout2]MEB0082832.1 DUF2818 family protein [Glaciimonas sp. Gout2]MEB0162946.1 DUF2818 family protein [Glaciimonas sp. CA11.2]
MNVSSSSWIVIFLALLAANLPFVNERLLALIPLKPGVIKPAWARLIELFVWYFIVGGIAYLLESRIGNRFTQDWEFFAVTGCLFLVFAFPGYVHRYLRKKRS